MRDLINGIFLIIISIPVFILSQRWIKSGYWLFSNLDYICTRCGGYVYLSPWQAMLSIHFVGRKWTRCPHCGEMSWVVPFRN